MATIVESIEISRRPEDVFSYVTDPAHLSDWQESVIRVRPADDASVGGTTKHVVTRRVGRRERDMTVEMTRNAPSGWTVRGVDGPVRGMVKGTVEPLADGERSRVTIALDFVGHGLGLLLVPLVVRSQAEPADSLIIVLARAGRTTAQSPADPSGGSLSS